MTVLCLACNNPQRIQGWCLSHFSQWKRAGFPRGWMPPTGCTVQGCTREHHSHGFCDYHRRSRVRSPCSVEGCVRPRHAYGLCAVHRRQQRRESGPRCSVGGCGRDLFARGWCYRHYDRWRDTGSIYGAKALPEPDLIRLRRLVGVPDDGPTEDMINRWKRMEAAS